MTGIKFNGPEDIRELNGHDLNRAGVEGFHKTEFHRGEVVIVDEATATGLVNNPELYGNFEIVEDGLLDLDEAEEPKKSSKKSATAK